MRKTSWLFVITVSMFFGSAAIAQKAPAKAAKTSKTSDAAAKLPGKPSAAGPYRVVATIKDLMDAMIDPAGDFIFDAVATIVTPGGTEEKAPKNDEEWAVVRNNAMVLIEGANLLMIPGRHVAAGSEKTLPKGKSLPSAAELGGELDPIAIEARIKVDRPMFIKLARGLQVAAAGALKAADAKDVQGLLAAGDVIDDACEQCHLRYWYPDQLELLDKADRLLRHTSIVRPGAK
jgi:hypothetical protein